MVKQKTIVLLCALLLMGFSKGRIKTEVCQLFFQKGDEIFPDRVSASCSNGKKEWVIEVMELEGHFCLSPKYFRKIGERLEQCERNGSP